MTQTGENLYFAFRFHKKDAEKFSTYHVLYYEVHKSQFSLTFVLDPREILILILIILSNLFSLLAIFKEENVFFFPLIFNGIDVD